VSLAEVLKQFAPNRIALQSGLGEISFGDLLEFRTLNEDKLYDLDIAISLNSIEEGLKIIVAADGICKSITIIPSSFSNDQKIKILNTVGANFYIGEDADEFKDTIDCQFFKNLTFIENKTVKEKATFDSRWNLVTSGTSGDPKLVQHDFSTLTRTTKPNQSSSDICHGWGLLYEYFRFAGLQVVLQSLHWGSKLIAPANYLSLKEKLDYLAKNCCTHLSATPTLWKSILMTPGFDELKLRQITMGGEIADQQILNSLSKIYTTSKITHVYASTEAGVGFSVQDGKAGFPLSFLESPPSGIKLRIVDEILEVKNKKMPLNYLGEGKVLRTEDGWISTGDRVKVSADRVYFLGRESGVINSGGNKIHPEEIEQLLLSYPDVASVRVYSKKSSIMGTLVASDIVFKQEVRDPVSLKKEIKFFLSDKTEAYKIPSLINFVDYIAFSGSGKINRS
jgi:acyl-CoA synthetase (AMP-forming)/AMP-acid ligase II